MREQNTTSGGIRIPEIILKILESRGIAEEMQEEFFSSRPRLAYDPFLLANMQEGVDLLLSAIDEGKRIVIYGDYDVDGITATSLLMKVISSLTDNVTYYIDNHQNNRHIQQRSHHYGEIVFIEAVENDHAHAFPVKNVLHKYRTCQQSS